MTLPNFLIPGANKSGSTTLWHYLGQHPDVLMSSAKEPHFFDANWDKGIQWYERFFDAYSGESAIGEGTPGYLACQDAAPRISATLPGVKLIIVLRDPVSRAVSHYWWKVSCGLERRTLTEVLRSGAEEYLVYRSRYYTHLARFAEYIPLERMHIFTTETMAESLAAVLRSIFAFLGVDEDVDVEDRGARNVGTNVRSRRVRVLLSHRRPRLVTEMARRVPASARPVARRIVTRVQRWNVSPAGSRATSEEDRALLADILRPEVEKLEALLGRTFPEWSLGG